MRVVLKRMKLREWLLTNSKTQAEFASQIGLTPESMSRLVGGDTQPSTRTRAALLEATGLDFRDLFTLVVDPVESSLQTVMAA